MRITVSMGCALAVVATLDNTLERVGTQHWIWTVMALIACAAWVHAAVYVLFKGVE